MRSRLGRDGGFALALGLALGAVGAWGGNNGVLLVGCLGLAAVGVDLLAGRRALARVQVRWELPADLFAGQPCRGAFAVDAPAGGVRGLQVGDGVAQASVEPGAARAPAWWRFEGRGRFALDGIAVSGLGPLGLSQHARELPGRAEGLVYPRPLPALPSPAGGADGRLAHPDPGVELRALRPYQPGDRLRDIHGRTSARVGQPMVVVRGLARSAAAQAEVRPEHPIEAELSRATAVVLDAGAQGLPVGLRLAGHPELDRAGEGLRWRRRLLDALALHPGAP